jgi:signal transduction histidine kinase
MEIQDNGKGFDPLSMEAQNGFSKGLSGMQKRADMINAQFFIESKEGQGVKIKVEGLI